MQPSSHGLMASTHTHTNTHRPQRIPLRLLIEGQPPLHPSLPCDAYGSLTLREAIEKMAPHLFVSPSQDGGEEEEEGDDDDGDTRGGKQQQQRCWPSSDYAFTCQVGTGRGGGEGGGLIRASAFHVFTPQHHRDLSSPHLHIQNDKHTQHNKTQGLCPPPWDASLLDAWRSLLHADFYLYITARRVTTTAVEEKGKEAAVS